MLSAQNISRPRPGQTAHVSPEGIIYCTDGKFRWAYEFDQRKRPTLLVSLLWKCMAVGGAAGAIPLLLRLGSDAGFLSGLLSMLICLTAGALVSLILFAAHLLQNGPIRCMLFTADESTVSCQLVKGKTNKEKVTHAIAAWVGGQSQPALRFFDPQTVRFDTVTSITPDPQRHRIRVNHLSVYADADAFPLVLRYFKRRCPEAVIKE